MKGILTILLSVAFGLAASADPGDQATAMWDQLLQKYVDNSGNVNYKGFKADPKFDACLEAFADQHPSVTWKESERMAFWINVYNAYTVKLIVDNYPLKSITDLKEPWDQQFINLKGNVYSLNHIEHKILRPVFNDPRVHFAVNCASYSCPKLHNKAFRAENLNSTLNSLTKGFLKDQKRNKITSSSPQVSQIFEWFKDDFAKDGGVVTFINKYSDTKIASGAELKYLEYGWSLNGQ